MAATLVTASTGQKGSESRRSSRASEIWTVTGGTGGSSDGDTGTITPMMKKPKHVIGAVSYSISGQTVTVAAIAALAEGEVIAVEVIGYPA